MHIDKGAIMVEYNKSVLKDLKDMYPGLWEEGYWINPDGKIEIRKMTKNHIENTINMLENRSPLSLYNLKKRDNKDELIMYIIELIEKKIEEFEDHLKKGRYDEYY